MATKLITPAIRSRAEQLADEASGWLPATSRVSGKRFYIVPNSTGSAAHYTNANGCTCRGWQFRGICAHSEAVKLLERRRMAEMAAEAAFQVENDRLFAGFERHDVVPAPALPAAASRFTKSYYDLFPDDDSLVDFG